MAEYSNGLTSRSDEGEKSSFQAIIEVEGVFLAPVRKKSKFEKGFKEGKAPPDQVEVVLAEACIIEMEKGYEAPELKDDRFTTWMNYAQPGKEKPNQNTFWQRGFCKSAEELMVAKGKPEGTWRDLVGERVRLRRLEIPIKIKDKESGETKEAALRGYVFTAGKGGVDIKDYARKHLVGLNKSAAKRELLVDGNLKFHPELRKALEEGTLGEMLDLVEDEKGIFAEKI